MAVNLDVLLIQIVLSIIFLAPILWIAGRLLAGREKAKFTDALWIVVIGNVISAIFQYFFTGIIATIILLIILLALVKHFFDTGWLKALAIAIVAAIFYFILAIIILAILVFVGIAAGGSLFI